MEHSAVLVPSTKDGSLQDCLFYSPRETGDSKPREPLPLLVILHTWSSSYAQCVDSLPIARDLGWIMIAPNFRGPNDRPEACASELAIQDILDAVEYAKTNAPVDPTRIYLMGSSGGGHMALMMAAKAPQLWAGVSAWVPISDLAAWHAECTQAKRAYSTMLEKCCGGPPGPATQAQYHARSPLFHLANARNIAIDVNAGIHDGHTGSVPISHTLRAFNALAEANGHSDAIIAEADIDFMCRREQVPPALANDIEADPERSRPVLLRRIAGPTRMTIFEGGHEHDMAAALGWLSRQRKGTPADFSVHSATRLPTSLVTGS